jgi:putative transposase
MFRYQLDPGLIDEMRSATRHGLIIGSERFKSEIETMFNQKVMPAKCGRPVKKLGNQGKGE